MNRTKLNLPPESIVYTGIYNNTQTVLEIFSYDAESFQFLVCSDENFESELTRVIENSKIVWLNVIGLNVVDTIIKLGEMFGLSSLMLEDIVHVSQRSKIETTEDYLFSLFKMIYSSGKTDQDQTVEVLHEHLSIILMDNIVITFQENMGDVFDSVRARIRNNNGKIRKLNADYLYYALLDALVDNQLYILATIGDEIDEHEQITIEEEGISMDRLFKLRKQLLLIRASVIPFKDIMVDLQSVKTECISQEVKVFLSDVSDHVNHVNDLVALYREMVNNIYEINMLNTGNKMNHIMAVLTVFSAIILPINILTGFFGMNFKYFTALEYRYAILYFIAASLSIIIGMVIFFKKKKWF